MRGAMRECASQMASQVGGRKWADSTCGIVLIRGPDTLLAILRNHSRRFVAMHIITHGVVVLESRGPSQFPRQEPMWLHCKIEHVEVLRWEECELFRVGDGRYYPSRFRASRAENRGEPMGVHEIVHKKNSMRVTRVFVFVLLLAGVSVAAAAQVRTDSGSVSGTTSADGKVQIFKGIPYAAPPV